MKTILARLRDVLRLVESSDASGGGASGTTAVGEYDFVTNIGAGGAQTMGGYVFEVRRRAEGGTMRTARDV